MAAPCPWKNGDRTRTRQKSRPGPCHHPPWSPFLLTQVALTASFAAQDTALLIEFESSLLFPLAGHPLLFRRVVWRHLAAAAYFQQQTRCRCRSGHDRRLRARARFISSDLCDRAFPAPPLPGKAAIRPTRPRSTKAATLCSSAAPRRSPTFDCGPYGRLSPLRSGSRRSSRAPSGSRPAVAAPLRGAPPSTLVAGPSPPVSLRLFAAPLDVRPRPLRGSGLSPA